jgi:hypothetical protein
MYYKLRVIELMVLNILGVLQKAEMFCIRVYMYTDTTALYMEQGPHGLKPATNTARVTMCKLHLQKRYNASDMNYC